MDNSVVRKAKDILHVLHDKVAFLPGSRDRENRPIIFVPAREGLENINRDHLRNLLLYLYEVTADDAKERGFVFIIDMRKGTSWSNVKPVLQCLQEFFPGSIAAVFIIKPENFWKKYAKSFSFAKYTFEIQMCSVDTLGKYADISQILREFGGTMQYDHDDWLDLRVYIEDVVNKASDMLTHFTKCSQSMCNAETPVDLKTAQLAMQQHEELHVFLSAMAVEVVEADVRQLETRILAQELHVNGMGGLPRGVNFNPDLTSIIPHLKRLILTLARTRMEVLNQWELKKQELDHCFQLKSFENDVETRCAYFQAKYNEIKRDFVNTGIDEHETQALINEFVGLDDAIRAEDVVYNQIMENGRRLFKLYASNAADANCIGSKTKIEEKLDQFERCWRCLLQLAEQRERLLKSALAVHKKCNLFLENCKIWDDNVGINPDSIINESHEMMKIALENHDNFYKQFEIVYSEAFASATSLLKLMDKLFKERDRQMTPSYQHLLNLITRVTMAQRQMHGVWKSRRDTIECRITSAAFFSDMRLVIDWLDKNGEPFLQRKTAIGHNRQSAMNLSNTHEEFRKVASRTYTNATQLFQMAQVLKDSGEVDSEAIIRATTELRCRITNFREKVALRTNLLFIAGNFFLHFDEIMNWYARMQSRSETVCIVPDSVEECEQNKKKLTQENDNTIQAFERVKQERTQLCHALKQQSEVLNIDNLDVVRYVEDLMSRIGVAHRNEEKRWPSQMAHLNAASRVASFLSDCAEIKKQLLSWSEDLNSLKHSVQGKAKVIVHYHRQNTESVRTAIQEARNQMNEIIQMMQKMNLVIGSTKQSADVAVTEATRELQFLEAKVMEIASEVTNRIEVQLQIDELNNKVEKAMKTIMDYQNGLIDMNVIPRNLEEAEVESKKFEEFGKKWERLAKDLTSLQQKCKTEVFMMANSPIVNHMMEQLMTKWQYLVGKLDSRWKLLDRSIAFFKCVEQVIPVSGQVENTFNNDCSDSCYQLLNQSPLEISVLEKALSQTVQNLNNHTGRKEMFVKAVTHGRNVSDGLLKCITRCENATEENIATCQAQVLHFKQQIQQSYERVIELWLKRKMWNNRCRNILLLLLAAMQINKEIRTEFDEYNPLLISLEQLKRDGSLNEQNLNKFDEKFDKLKTFVKNIRKNVRATIDRTTDGRDKYVDDFHRGLIDEAEKCVKEAFGLIFGLYTQLDIALREARGERLDLTGGVPGRANTSIVAQRNTATVDTAHYKEDLSLERYSDSTIEEKLRKDSTIGTESAGLSGATCIFAANEASNVNRELIAPMNELIKTEKSYIEALKIGVGIYLEAYRMAGAMCPSVLRDKEHEIFGNLEDLYIFHSELFLPDLLGYERHPEDVGYCFIQWLERLKELYADYCINKEENNHLIGIPEAIQFFSEIREQNGLPHSSDLGSIFIQPVQRITRYMLILKNFLDKSTSNSRGLKDVLEAVSNITKLANDRIHLKNFENAEEHRAGDFVMQDTFIVFEPKRYFKREREFQIFLFESNIVFTKREEIAGKTRYVYKDSMLLREIHIVEHIEGDNTKFGLRKENQIHQNDSTIILKPTKETNRMLWVKTLRNLKLDFKLDAKKSSFIDTTSLSSSNGGGNRSSQVSRDSNPSNAIGSGAPEDRFSVASTSSANSLTGTVGPIKNAEQFLVGEDFNATDDGQISVKSGQRVEVLDRTCSEEFVAVAIVDEEGLVRRGRIPTRILLPAVNTAGETSREETTTNTETGDATSATKRSSLRRFFNNNNNNNNSAANSSEQPAGSSNSSNAFGNFANDTAAAAGGNAPLSSIAHGPASASASTHKQSSRLSVFSTPIDAKPSNSSSSTAVVPPTSGEFFTSLASLAIDSDVPPPMSQLSSEPIPTAMAAADAFEDSTLMNESGKPDENSRDGEGDSPPNASDSAAGTPLAAASDQLMDAAEMARKRRSYVLAELVETERLYVQDLTSIVDGYIANLSSMELPEDLQGKDKIIFANIAQILDFHKTTFLKDIEKCLENYEAVGHAFIKHERRLDSLYVKYCQNKPKSDFLVSQDSFEQFFADTKAKLGHRVALCDLLIKPIQRITKYQLMLSDILKYTQRAGDRTEVLERGLDVMRVVPKACDDMMQVGRLQNFEGNLNAQGRLLYQGTLQISDGSPSQPFRGKDRQVFLFEQSAIIADYIPPRTEYGNPTYIFKNKIMVNKMVLEENVIDEPTRFVLKSNDLSQPAVFVAQAASMEDKQKWLAKISAQLDQQKTFLAALVDPKKYQNQLASSVNALSLGGKKDSSGSLDASTPPMSVGSNNFASPKHHHNNTSHHNVSTKSSSKLFGFSKSKS